MVERRDLPHGEPFSVEERQVFRLTVVHHGFQGWSALTPQTADSTGVDSPRPSAWERVIKEDTRAALRIRGRRTRTRKGRGTEGGTLLVA